MGESAFLRERFVDSFAEIEELVSLAYGSNSFYREKWQRANIRPEDIKSAADVDRLPFTTKEEICGKPWLLLTVPKRQICQIHASVPASQSPRIYIPLSDNDLCRGGLRPFTRGTSFSPPLPMNVSETDYVINALPYEVSYLGFLFHRILQDGVGAGMVPVGKGGFYSIPEKSLRIMKDLGGDHLFTTPAYAIYLAEKAQEVGYEAGTDLKPKSLWLTGESCAPGLRKRIEDLWKSDAYLCLSSLECGPMALECTEKDGMHVATGYVFVEIAPMRDGSLKLPDGGGEIVATVLWRHSSPLFRYRTGLVGSLDLTPCACGLESPRIRFGGDKAEFLELSKTKLSLLEIEDCLAKLPELDTWYYLQAGGDTLTILIPAGLSAQKKRELKDNAEKNLRQRLEIRLKVEVEEHSLSYKGEHWNRVLAP